MAWKDIELSKPQNALYEQWGWFGTSFRRDSTLLDAYNLNPLPEPQPTVEPPIAPPAIQRTYRHLETISRRKSPTSFHIIDYPNLPSEIKPEEVTISKAISGYENFTSHLPLHVKLFFIPVIRRVKRFKEEYFNWLDQQRQVYVDSLRPNERKWLAYATDLTGRTRYASKNIISSSNSVGRDGFVRIDTTSESPQSPSTRDQSNFLSPMHGREAADYTPQERQDHSRAYNERLTDDWRSYERGDTDRRPPLW